MPLTVKEKDHWRNRIARRIDHAIEELQAAEDPGFQKRIGEEAEKQAWNSLGLNDLRKEDQSIQSEMKRLSERQSVVWKENGIHCHRQTDHRGSWSIYIAAVGPLCGRSSS